MNLPEVGSAQQSYIAIGSFQLLMEPQWTNPFHRESLLSYRLKDAGYSKAM